ncbi:hypothetical protein OGAPHI_000736 [Ogataea philodendri]|uniref:N-acetylglucosamine-induced protein 1 n=1 Tax=Ogataea philodendri TaxID=1378263 RepID=A0A9P8PG65_9ASCO|nr:uncharacterized protein OGAPHI_000736 [Ogataea philodendri]KAH3671025.1 hypothetical protein OGAPHI_000736 [Ogataea philodendri]
MSDLANSKGPMPFSLIKQLVTNGEIDKLVRSEEVMKEYTAHKEKFKKQGADMITFILSRELKWVPQDVPLNTPSEQLIEAFVKPADSRMFANEADITIVQNTFPYYVEPGVQHLCVWVKFPMPPDPQSDKGDISPKDKQLVEKYITNTFCNWLGIPRSDLVWFKNWTSLQSVRSIPHIHVIIKDMDQDSLDKVLRTGGKALNYGTEDCKL